jgi:hypothetical protein
LQRDSALTIHHHHHLPLLLLLLLPLLLQVKAIRNLNGHSIGPYQIHAGVGAALCVWQQVVSDSVIACSDAQQLQCQGMAITWTHFKSYLCLLVRVL